MDSTSSSNRPSTPSSACLPPQIQSKLGHRNHQKRQAAADKLVDMVKKLYDKSEMAKIRTIIELLCSEYVSSDIISDKKGGLLAVTVVIDGLRNHTHGEDLYSTGVLDLEKIVPPVSYACCHDAIGIRYQACRALFNIIEVAKENIIVCFQIIFVVLCTLAEETHDHIRAEVEILNQSLKNFAIKSDDFSFEFEMSMRRQFDHLVPGNSKCIFLISWIDEVNESKEMDIMPFLATFLEGLLAMSNHFDSEVSNKAVSTLHKILEKAESYPSIIFDRTVSILIRRASSSDHFTRLTGFIWMHEFVIIFGKDLVFYYDEMLKVILPAISDKDEKIRTVASQTNEDIRATALLSYKIFKKENQLCCESETTRIGALHWIKALLKLRLRRDKATPFPEDLLQTLLNAISKASSTEELHLIVELLVSQSSGPETIKNVLLSLVRAFCDNIELLNNHGTTIISQLCVHSSDAKTVYEQLADVLKKNVQDMDFVPKMVQVLTNALLTSSELRGLRALLVKSFAENGDSSFFHALFVVWCHSPASTLCLCLLSQAYLLTMKVIRELEADDLNSEFYVCMDTYISSLLEGSANLQLRLQLLEPQRNAWLVRTLYGLQMLLPQKSEAFKTLQHRLTSIPPSYAQEGQLSDKKLRGLDHKQDNMFEHFKNVKKDQQRHQKKLEELKKKKKKKKEARPQRENPVSFREWLNREGAAFGN